MRIGRREFVVASGTAVAYALLPSQWVNGETKMHGLIGKALAVEGKRDELIKILLEGVSGMPGCLSYVVAKDPADQNAIWITEVWDSKESHAASLKLPAVKAAITKGRPLFASFQMSQTTEPVGGHGLPKK
ncbi:MAG TPA: putative quinol monooxygenase [Pyrinomonadaceae bacterium]|nr:putative quinol monooxygenase [Pyrinomonadaceae bacterium]